jgi:hypothetical protein
MRVARWYEQRAKIEELAARERQAAGGRDKGTKIITEAPKKGEAKAIAAADAGMSRPTAERAVAVTHAIDEAEAAGDVETAADDRHRGGRRRTVQ